MTAGGTIHDHKAGIRADLYGHNVAIVDGITVVGNIYGHNVAIVDGITVVGNR